jgi:S-(hydroxymethyl)mycothiol dehydrogenase
VHQLRRAGHWRIGVGAKLAGATTIVTRPERRPEAGVARRVGATRAVHPKKTNAVEAMRATRVAFWVDVAIDAVRHPAVFEQP